MAILVDFEPIRVVAFILAYTLSHNDGHSSKVLLLGGDNLMKELWVSLGEVTIDDDYRVLRLE